MKYVDPSGHSYTNNEVGDILFGQRRITDTFRKNSEAPEYIEGRKLADVAEDIKNGILSTDQFEVKYFIDAKTGNKIAESNRTLAVLSMAVKKPTKVKEIIPSKEVLNRLEEKPIRYRGETLGIRSTAIPITIGQKNITIIEIVRIVQN